MKPSMQWMKDGKLSAVMGPADRPSLNGAWLRPERSDGEWLMTATDSYVMCWKKVVINADGPLRERAQHPSQKDAIFVPPRAVHELEVSREYTFAEFEEDGSVTVGDVTFHLPEPGAVISFETGQQKFEREGRPFQPTPIPSPSKWEAEREQEFQVGMDVKLLGSAARALGNTRLKFTFDAKNPLGPVGLSSQLKYNPGAAGLLMPMRLGE